MVRLEDVPYRRRSGVTNQPWRRDVACEGERPGLQVDGDENSDRVPLAPAGDDQLKVGGTIAVTTSPPIDPVAHGLRVILTTNAGVGLADLTAPAGSKWSMNRAGTAWKYRDPLVSSGILNAKVQSIKPDGTLRVKVKARGLALGAAPAGTPPVATIAFGAPIAAPGQCGVTAFAACRTLMNEATVRCP